MITVDDTTRRRPTRRRPETLREQQIRETRTLAGRALNRAKADYRTHRDRTRTIAAEHARRAAIEKDWAAQHSRITKSVVADLDDELREIYLDAGTLTDEKVDELFREIAAADRRAAVLRWRMDPHRNLDRAKTIERARINEYDQIPDPAQRAIFLTHAVLTEDDLDDLFHQIAERQQTLQHRIDNDPEYAEQETARRARIEADTMMDPALRAIYLDTTILDTDDIMAALDVSEQTVWGWRSPRPEERRQQPHPRVSPLIDVAVGRVADKDVPGVQWGKLVEWLIETHRFLWDAATGQIVKNPNPPRSGRPSQPR